jgi:hypothetical protein
MSRNLPAFFFGRSISYWTPSSENLTGNPNPAAGGPTADDDTAAGTAMPPLATVPQPLEHLPDLDEAEDAADPPSRK